MERDAERRRLLLVRHRRLDRLGARRRSGCRTAPGAARRTSRSGPWRVRPGTSALRKWSVSIAIVSPSASRSRLITRICSDGDTCRNRPSRAPARIVAHREGAASGHHSAPPHVLAERGDRQLLGDLRVLDVGAAATPPHEVALPRKVVEGGPHGQPRDAEVGAQLPLRRNRGAHPQLLDQVEHVLARVALLRHLRRALIGPSRL